MEERFKNWMPPEIEEGKLTKWNWMVQHKENLKLGEKVDIGAFCYLNAKTKITIEDNVQISSHCSIYSVSTIDEKEGSVVLKKNCKIGAHTVIMPGVTIGENAVIGAHSMVNKSIPANVIAFGIPCKVYKTLNSLESESLKTTPEVPLFKIHSDTKDIESISDIITRGASWANGSEIEQFEARIAEYTGRKYAVVFNSGTSALHALLLAHNINSNHEVIVPSFTFISTAHSALFTGAKPVFAEIELNTLALDVEDVKKKITGKTKAIILVHYAGHPSINTLELKKLSQDYNLLLIEDAAESLGAEIQGKKIGSFGDSAIFSFCQNKIITTGEGGAALTDSEEIYKKLKLLCSHGRISESYFSGGDSDYISLGYNWRMPTMLAALGLSQFEKINKIIPKRIEKAEHYNAYLSKIPQIKTITPPKDFLSVYQIYSILLKDKQTRDYLKEFLKNKGISTKIYFEPIHLTRFYKDSFGFREGDFPITESISERILSLPIYPDLTREQQDKIIKNINIFFKNE